jgi:hypothetical protein
VSQIALPIAALPLLLAAAPPPLEPSSKWAVDYGEQRCTLYRSFGEGKSNVRLFFEQSSPRGSITALVSGKGLRPGNGRRDHRLEFQSLGGVFLDAGMSVVTSQDEHQAVYFAPGFARGKWGLISDDAALRLAESLPPGKDAGRPIPGVKPRPIKWEDRNWRLDDRATRESDERAFDDRAARVETVALDPGKRGAVVLRTGSLSSPLKALEKCAVASLKDWGVDPAVEDTIVEAAHPINDPYGLFTAADYPSSALAKGKESRLKVWLNLDSAGRVTTCRVISTFATPEINDRMCKLVQQRQKFMPAKSADGVAVASYYVESFNFELR